MSRFFQILAMRYNEQHVLLSSLMNDANANVMSQATINYLWRSTKDSFRVLEHQVDDDLRVLDAKDLYELRSVIDRIVLKSESTASSASQFITADAPHNLSNNSAGAVTVAVEADEDADDEGRQRKGNSRYVSKSHGVGETACSTAASPRHSREVLQSTYIPTGASLLGKRPSSAVENGGSQLPAIAGTRGKLAYTTEEEAAILAAYKKGRATGRPWAQSCEILAAQLGRSEAAVSRKIRDLCPTAVIRDSAQAVPKSVPKAAPEATLHAAPAAPVSPSAAPATGRVRIASGSARRNDFTQSEDSLILTSFEQCRAAHTGWAQRCVSIARQLGQKAEDVDERRRELVAADPARCKSPPLPLRQSGAPGKTSVSAAARQGQHSTSYATRRTNTAPAAMAPANVSERGHGVSYTAADEAYILASFRECRAADAKWTPRCRAIASQMGRSEAAIDRKLRDLLIAAATASENSVAPISTAFRSPTPAAAKPASNAQTSPVAAASEVQHGSQYTLREDRQILAAYQETLAAGDRWETRCQALATEMGRTYAAVDKKMRVLLKKGAHAHQQQEQLAVHGPGLQQARHVLLVGAGTGAAGARSSTNHPTQSAAPAEGPAADATNVRVPYTAGQEALILRGYEECAAAGTAWSARRAELAAELGRTVAGIDRKLRELQERLMKKDRKSRGNDAEKQSKVSGGTGGHKLLSGAMLQSGSGAQDKGSGGGNSLDDRGGIDDDEHSSGEGEEEEAEWSSGDSGSENRSLSSDDEDAAR